MKPLSWIDNLVAYAARFGLSEAFLRFGVVGALGFVWDTSTVYALRPFTNLYIAGTCGFFVAATLNWLCNRLWTFKAAQHAPAHIQWAKFLATNALGFVFNRGAFFLLIATSSFVVAHPVVGIAAGAFVGLGFNYLLSKRFVFL